MEEGLFGSDATGGVHILRRAPPNRVSNRMTLRRAARENSRGRGIARHESSKNTKNAMEGQRDNTDDIDNDGSERRMSKRKKMKSWKTRDDDNSSEDDRGDHIENEREKLDDGCDDSDTEDDIGQRMSKRVFQMLRDMDNILNEANNDALTGLKDFVRQSRWSWSGKSTSQGPYMKSK